MVATPSEVMTVVAARMLQEGTVCFVGIGIPSKAANLARLTHAPNAVLIYESGTIGTRPTVLPLSIGDGELAVTADTVVSTSEIFSYWLQGGRVEVGFLGAAQVDRYANLNSTVIGNYQAPKVRLPGAGGAPEIAAQAKETLIIINHDRRKLVEKVDFITSAGYLDGGDSRERAGLKAGGPTAVITDLCVLRPESQTRELVVTQLHPGVTRERVAEATGWDVRFAKDLSQTQVPSDLELSTLRELERQTALAHSIDAEDKTHLNRIDSKTEVTRP
ncbi:MAG: 3-oxoadipate--succinyl-CoA transferase subunit B [Rhodopirellula sp.]|nr:3-oxoadipate--succinyl-CoA transferase subunit B [Rhodopirellula sp.]OUX51030.1 MAG: 3-oxoadipate--succinyl-CoA transferase subunit B [Rhodopirellula sp. TMED283]